MWMLVAEYKALNAKKMTEWQLCVIDEKTLLSLPTHGQTMLLCYAQRPWDHWIYDFQDSLDNTNKPRQTNREQSLSYKLWILMPAVVNRSLTD